MFNPKICIVGCGYVGLPLAVLLSRHFSVSAFDINKEKIESFKQGRDITNEVGGEVLKNSNINFSSDENIIKSADFVIVAVPTPIDKANNPDLSMVKSASALVGRNLKQGAVVVFESTVYPGVTEEICAPIIEKNSGLKFGEGFKLGYSPERVNPGDKERTIDKIVKIVSASDDEALEKMVFVYGKICNAGLHKSPNIKTAEAAKVIENIQRDLNIALMTELAVLFDKMNINVHDVLSAAGTKVNFHNYKPGLVGGHCIGVDPYYLTHKAVELGHYPEVILAGRRINDNMHLFYAQKIIKKLIKTGKKISGAKVLLFGLTFKSNVNDPRNSRVKHLIKELKDHDIFVFGCDPMLDDVVVAQEFGIQNLKLNEINGFDLKIMVVRHDCFNGLPDDVLDLYKLK